MADFSPAGRLGSEVSLAAKSAKLVSAVVVAYDEAATLRVEQFGNSCSAHQ